MNNKKKSFKSDCNQLAWQDSHHLRWPFSVLDQTISKQYSEHKGLFGTYSQAIYIKLCISLSLCSYKFKSF